MRARRMRGGEVHRRKGMKAEALESIFNITYQSARHLKM